MKNNNLLIICSVIMIILLSFMGFNYFISPLSDMIIRIVGVMMIVNLVVLTYNTMKLKK